MTIQFSTAVRNARADAWASAVGPSAVLRIRTGAPPANCAASDSGTALASFSFGSTWTSAASGGVKEVSGLPITVTGSATGIAGHYRLYASNGTTCHEQGTVTITGGGGDMVVDNTSIASGAAWTPVRSHPGAPVVARRGADAATAQPGWSPSRRSAGAVTTQVKRRREAA